MHMFASWVVPLRLLFGPFLVRFAGGAFARAVHHANAPRLLESESEVKVWPASLGSPG